MSDSLAHMIALHALPERRQEAAQLAERFNLPLAAGISKTPYKLWLGAERLELQDCRPGAAGPIFVDFTGGRAEHRRLFGGGKNQPLARAVGIRDKQRPCIVDATAGLGRDAFVLATLGCEVTLIERSPVLAALLADGLLRAGLNAATADIAARMRLVHADAKQYLSKHGCAADTVYLDPMYPHRSKSALVKKEMRLARELVGDDEDATELLHIAIQHSGKRVTVKRPAIAAPLGERKPSAQISSKNTRYDVYIVSNANEKT